MKYTDAEFRYKYDIWKSDDESYLIGGMTFIFLAIITLFVGIYFSIDYSLDSIKSWWSAFMSEAFHIDLSEMLVLWPFLVTFMVSGFMFFTSYKFFMHKADEQKKFLTDVEATETQASRRNIYIYNNPVLKEYLPLVRKICDFNPEARHQQEQIINGWYKNPIYDFWDTSDAFLYYLSTESSIRCLLRHEMSERKAFVSKLFQLAIAEDGIHLDEWHYLIDLMERLKFNKVSINFFKKRYYSLRTEFDEEERKKFAEDAAPSVSQINSYYAVLGLNEGATDDEIKKAYHALALQHHPDLPKNAERIQECEEMMAKINEAYNKIIKI